MALISYLAVLQFFISLASAFDPVVYPASIDTQCHSAGDAVFDDELLEALTAAHQRLPPQGCLRATRVSCADILYCNSSASSGYYQIQAANGSQVQVYCDMEGANCGGEGGWTRVFRLNMTDPSSQCPTGFSLTTQNGIRFCTRSNTGVGCTGINTDNYGLNYTQVCGFARGYAFNTPDAFGIHNPRTSSEPLSGNYVDGVSITYGTPPNHLWTYAAGVSEDSGFNVNFACPCNTDGVPSTVPSYVGSDYYCEAGAAGDTVANRQGWITTDPLWDGMLCRGTEGPCCVSPTLPWFMRNMLNPTNDDILIRVCLDQGASDETIGLEQVEIYIK